MTNTEKQGTYSSGPSARPKLSTVPPRDEDAKSQRFRDAGITTGREHEREFHRKPTPSERCRDLPGMTVEHARELTDTLVDAVDEAHEKVEIVCALLKDVYVGQVWVALGYNTWSDYLDNEVPLLRQIEWSVSQRRQLSSTLEEQAGMSSRAVAEVAGVSHTTIENDRKISGKKVASHRGKDGRVTRDRIAITKPTTAAELRIEAVEAETARLIEARPWSEPQLAQIEENVALVRKLFDQGQLRPQSETRDGFDSLLARLKRNIEALTDEPYSPRLDKVRKALQAGIDRIDHAEKGTLTG